MSTVEPPPSSAPPTARVAAPAAGPGGNPQARAVPGAPAAPAAGGQRLSAAAQAMAAAAHAVTPVAGAYAPPSRGGPAPGTPGPMPAAGARPAAPPAGYARTAPPAGSPPAGYAPAAPAGYTPAAPAGYAPASPSGYAPGAPTAPSPTATPAAAPAAPAAPGPAVAPWQRTAPAPTAPAPKFDAARADDDAYRRASTEQAAGEDDISLPEVLDAMIERGASDLHLTAGAPPVIRVHGSVEPLAGYSVLDAAMIQRTLYGAITQTQRERFEADRELDFSYSLPGRGRFRVNLYRQKDALGAAFRMIPFEIKSLDSLGIPAQVREFANLPRGFVLVTGPTGSGKSTTLAALIDHANSTRSEHIMTVEDPIEFLHEHKRCLVNQREVGTDTNSFTNALKHVLRQDPDIILVGEMRDLETISVALTAAETGHLVFATLHTQDAAQTIDRIIDVFPPHQQQQVRQQLAGSLQGVVCQTLCKTLNGKGRVVATEVLVITPAVRNLIREGKTHQIYSAMQAGAKHGMHTLDQHLAQLVREGKISYEVGLDKCHNLPDYNKLCGRG